MSDHQNDQAERPQDALRRFKIEAASEIYSAADEPVTSAEETRRKHVTQRYMATTAVEHDLQMARDRTMERIAVALEAIAMNGIPRLNQ